jgi:hypothetical protein
MPYWIRTELLAEMGRYQDATANLSLARQHGGRAIELDALLAMIAARTGRRSEARRILDSLRKTVDSSSFASPTVAYAYTALDQKDQAFEVLFRGNGPQHPRDSPESRSPLAPLHTDPRWTELLRRMNLPTP